MPSRRGLLALLGGKNRVVCPKLDYNQHDSLYLDRVRARTSGIFAISETAEIHLETFGRGGGPGSFVVCGIQSHRRLRRFVSRTDRHVMSYVVAQICKMAALPPTIMSIRIKRLTVRSTGRTSFVPKLRQETNSRSTSIAFEFHRCVNGCTPPRSTHFRS